MRDQDESLRWTRCEVKDHFYGWSVFLFASLADVAKGGDGGDLSSIVVARGTTEEVPLLRRS
jgi:hypothetical protein